MSTDVFYGQGAELRVGSMASATTDPTAWHTLEFISLQLSPGRDRIDRPKLGVALHNPIDSRAKVPGIERLSGEIVVPCDTRQLPRWLRLGLGAPTTTGSATPYAHTWSSGSTTAALFAVQVKLGDTDVRVFRGLTISALSIDARGEQVNNFDVRLQLRGLSEERRTAFLTPAPTAVPAVAEARRTVFLVDGVAAARVEQAQWSYDRQVGDELFLSQNPVISGVRPEAGMSTGSATFRAVGKTYDDLEAADTAFAATLRAFGALANHQVDFVTPIARFGPSPRSVDGPGQIRRSWSWDGEQNATTPVARIVVSNDVASYAT